MCALFIRAICGFCKNFKTMLISYNWLKEYFPKRQLPSAQEVGQLLTMHAFELDGMAEKYGDTIFDLKVLPNRAHDCLSHDGVARELSAILNWPIEEVLTGIEKKTEALSLPDGFSVEVLDQSLAKDYILVKVSGLTNRSSPEFLTNRLLALGQRPINLIVDATNYAMLKTGQPLHAFDLKKISANDSGKAAVFVRLAKAGERMISLDEKKVSLDEKMLVIADAQKVLGLAGVKGGKEVEVDLSTTEILLEAANFSAENIRATSQKVAIRTEASKRFENEISPVLIWRGLSVALEILQKENSSTIKISPPAGLLSKPRNKYYVGLTKEKTNTLLGANFLLDDLKFFLERLGFEYLEKTPQEVLVENFPKTLGAKYLWGASTSYDAPEFFDCTSLTSFLYFRAGVNLPRVSVDQYFFGQPVKETELSFGDLIFSYNEPSKDGPPIRQKTFQFLPGQTDEKIREGITYVGFYLGEGKVLHASPKFLKGEVVIENLADSLAFKNIRGFRRVISAEQMLEKRLIVCPPAERLDLLAKKFLVSGTEEDLIEEIVRLFGLQNLASDLPIKTEKINQTSPNIEFAIREKLIKLGYSEILTYALVKGGYFELLNSFTEEKRSLREDLVGDQNEGLMSALIKNARQGPLLGEYESIKIFEVGAVFPKSGEEKNLAVGVISLLAGKRGGVIKQKLKEELQKFFQDIGAVSPRVLEFTEDIFSGFVYEIPIWSIKKEISADINLQIDKRQLTVAKESPYPFLMRDIAFFAPPDFKEETGEKLIRQNGGEHLLRVDLFDVFQKTDEAGQVKTSYAYHLVFQSQRGTLTDREVDIHLTSISEALAKAGCSLR